MLDTVRTFSFGLPLPHNPLLTLITTCNFEDSVCICITLWDKFLFSLQLRTETKARTNITSTKAVNKMF